MCLERLRTLTWGSFVCTRTMGVSTPSLHRESTDSLMMLSDNLGIEVACLHKFHFSELNIGY